MSEQDERLAQVTATSAKLSATAERLETLVQNAAAMLGARGIHFGIEADELIADLRQNLGLEGHYMGQVSGKLTQSKELIRVGTLLNSSLDLEYVLQEVIDTIINLTHAARAYLMLSEEDTLTAYIARNWDRETLSEEEIIFSRGIVDSALQSGEVILSANAQADPRFKRMASVFHHQLRSVFCLPLLAHEKTIGVIYGDNGDRGTPFDTELMPALTAFANQAAIAIENARLFQRSQSQAEALQRSREQIITAREEERRRLRRDLHDGLGPILGGFTLKIDAARKQVKREPDTAEETLVALKQQVKRAIEDVRRIVYDLRPPALEELGLLGALQEHARNLNGLQVEIVAPKTMPPLSAAMEVALYRIATEALTNVIKHAHAARCTIRFEVDRAMILTISDDGCGMPAKERAGVGLLSMHERTAELGGTCTIESSPMQGTRIQVCLPLTLDTP